MHLPDNGGHPPHLQPPGLPRRRGALSLLIWPETQFRKASRVVCLTSCLVLLQAPVQDITCHPTVEPPEPLEEEADPKAAEEAVGGEEEEELHTTSQWSGVLPEGMVAVHLEDIDAAALEDLVSSLIQMGSQEDPDTDFFELDVEDDEEQSERDEL